jgi:hypothetical protein
MNKKPDVKQNGQARVYAPEKIRTKEAALKAVGHKTNEMDMREMAARDTRYHLQPMPEATPAEINPFPAPILRGLAIGSIVGLLVGIGWAALLLNGQVVISGWEGLFSMTPSAFFVFWAVIGLALGGFLTGTVAILIHPNPS